MSLEPQQNHIYPSQFASEPLGNPNPGVPAPIPPTRVRSKRRGSKGIIAACAGFSLLAGGLGVGAGVLIANPSDNPTITTVNAEGQNAAPALALDDYSSVINESLPSVVTIAVRVGERGGSGSGVVLNDQGYIVTNAHVATLDGLANDGTIVVQTSSGDSYSAELVGIDMVADLAVLKIPENAEGIEPIAFASSSDISVGNTTIAIGSPLGLSGTVTTGIVSALNRPINIPSASGETVSLSVIQTDASINSGNSGGALLDNKGDLIGINVAISSTPDSQGSIGIGYAIPSDYVQRIVGEIISQGYANHATLGVSVADSVDELRTFPNGALVSEVVEGSPAADSGLETGDVIVEFGEQRIDSSIQLVAMVKQHAPQSEVEVVYVRNGQENTTTITLDG